MADRRYERFLAGIGRREGVAEAEAERIARATLETLAEQLPWGEASELAAALPDPPRTWLLEARGDAGRIHAEEFVRRVAEREGTDLATAEPHARATLVALAEVVPPSVMADLVRRLPNDYRPLLRDSRRTRRAAASVPDEAEP